MRNPIGDTVRTFLAELIAIDPPAHATNDRYNRRTPAALWRTITEVVLPTWLPTRYARLTRAQIAFRRGWLRWYTAAAALAVLALLVKLHVLEDPFVWAGRRLSGVHVLGLVACGVAYGYFRATRQADKDARTRGGCRGRR